MSETSGEMRGAEALGRVLKGAGVEVYFANPGTTEMALVEGLQKAEMKGVLCLHETVCSGAADGYARMTKKPAATVVHLGVGLANSLANLHNAKRAFSPILNLVGDMASWHLAKDPLLASDIEALATYCGSAVTLQRETLQHETVKALQSIRDFRCESRIATMIVPHDLQTQQVSIETCQSLFEFEDSFDDALKLYPQVTDTLQKIRAKLQSHETGFLVGGEGLHAEAWPYLNFNAQLIVENAFARIDRGGPLFARVPYFPADALKFFQQFETVVIIGAKKPVAMFGYQDGISDVVTCDVIEFDAIDVIGCLKHLSHGTDTSSKGSTPQKKKPPAPSLNGTAKLNPSRLCRVLAQEQPENAIVVDESLTSGGSYWDESSGLCFTHLTLTGGSIGIGPCLAVGCSIACPDRRVINFQADGSCLYSTPAFYTQVAQHLDITTLICANDSYQILTIEQHKQRLPTNPTFTSLTQPTIDWVSLALGYGFRHALKVTTVDQLQAALRQSFHTSGPFLIHCCLT